MQLKQKHEPSVQCLNTEAEQALNSVCFGVQVGNHSQKSEPIKCQLDTSHDPSPPDPARMARQHSRTAAPLVGYLLVGSILLLS